jgi:arylsulfatase A-like enzyme
VSRPRVWAGCVCALLLALSCTDVRSADRADRRSAPRPNVILIVTDDQRVDTMSVMPSTRRLFGEGGTRFTEAFTTTPQCCPARASLMTGRYSHNTTVRENNDGDLLDHRTTVQHYLRRAGYLTAMVGKFLQGRPLDRDPENFQRWTMAAWGYYDRPFNVGGRLRTVARYSTTFMASAALRYLRRFERNDERPWMLYVAPLAAHLPYTPERRYRDARVPALTRTPANMEKDLGDKPAYVTGPSRSTGFEYSDVTSIFRRQLRTLISVDDLVKRLFRNLDRHGENERTLAFFVSDSGHLLGEHGLFGKRLPYEPAVRVPLYARWPGHFGADVEDDRLVAIVDIAPTILDAAGISAVQPAMDGRSLLADHERDALLLEQYENSDLPDWASIVTPTSQYVEYLERATGRPRDSELYDRAGDPWQLDNLLAGEEVGNVAEARRAAELLHSVIDCRGASCP